VGAFEEQILKAENQFLETQMTYRRPHLICSYLKERGGGISGK
jgi:hypothetical protein